MEGISTDRRNRHYLLPSLRFVICLCLAQGAAAMAATAPTLGSLSTYGIVSQTYTNNLNPTIINGDVCYTTGPATPATTITGVLKVPCGAEIGDQGAALTGLDSQLATCTTLGAAVDLSTVAVGGGTPGVIPPGCYSSTGAMSVTSTVTLSGSGVYIFRPGAGVSAAALNTSDGSNVVLNAGACAADVFWAPTNATTLGANSTFVGTIIGAAGLTMGNSATLLGRALTAGGTATTAANTITVPSACVSPTLPTVSVTKVSNGGTGTFGFSGSNGFANQNITTTSAGVGVSGATQALTAAGASTTITESAPPTGYALTSISCNGLGAGGVATPNIGARTVTLDAAATAAGAAIACTFTNTFSSPGGQVTSVPTLSEWSLIILSGLMATFAFVQIRKRKGASF